MNNMFEMQVSAKLDCVSTVLAACRLLGSLLSLDALGKHAGLTLMKRESEPVITNFPCILYCRIIVLH